MPSFPRPVAVRLSQRGDKPIGMQALADLGFIVVQIDGMGTMHRSGLPRCGLKNLRRCRFSGPYRLAPSAGRARFSYDIEGGIGICSASAGGQNACRRCCSTAMCTASRSA